jgi:hypothetical protein
LHGGYRIELTDKVHFGIDLPSLKLRDVTIAQANSPNSDPWIRLPSLEVTDSSMTLEKRSIQIAEFRWSGPSVTAWREADGRLNLSQLVGDPTAPENSAAGQRNIFRRLEPGSRNHRRTGGDSGCRRSNGITSG